MSNEQVVAYKAEGEALMKQFTEVLKKIKDLGFNVMAQTDNTLYIFKDTREAYGTLLPPPQPNKVVKLQQPGEANAS